MKINKLKIALVAVTICCLTINFQENSIAMDLTNIKEMNEKESEYLNFIFQQYETLKVNEDETLKVNEAEKLSAGSERQNQDSLISAVKIKEKIASVTEETTQELEEAFQLPQSYRIPKYNPDADQPHTEQEKKYVSVLSLDGGGFRGLMEAYWLDYLSKITNRQPYQIFDLIAGTSIGGILATAATTPNYQNSKVPVLSTNDMIDLFVKNGEKIFPQREKYNILGKAYDRVTNIWWARYPEAPLEEMLVSYFGNRRLKSALTNVIVTAATTEHKPILFSSFDKHTQDYMVFEAARATSAAPSYFEAFPLILPGNRSKQYLMDGGMWQNNPAKLACEQALQWGYKENHRFDQERMIMLSLGTGQMPIHVHPTNAGLANSLFPALESFMNIPSEGVHAGMESMLKENYKRINPILDKNIALDVIGPDNILLLQKAAETKYEDIDTFAREGSLRLVLEQSEK